MNVPFKAAEVRPQHSGPSCWRTDARAHAKGTTRRRRHRAKSLRGSGTDPPITSGLCLPAQAIDDAYGSIRGLRHTTVPNTAAMIARATVPTPSVSDQEFASRRCNLRATDTLLSCFNCIRAVCARSRSAPRPESTSNSKPTDAGGAVARRTQRSRAGHALCRAQCMATRDPIEKARILRDKAARLFTEA